MRQPLLLILLGLVLQLWPGEARGFHIRVYGVVTDHFTGEPVKGVQVRMVKDSIERETVQTTWNGRYELFLERGYAYELHYGRRGMVTKHVLIDAREIPLFPDVPFFEMDIQMTMIEDLEGFDLSAFSPPVGRAEYKHSVRNLNWDVEYTRIRRTELGRVMNEYEREMKLRQRTVRGTPASTGRKKRKMVHF
jgi:hypothetical protein